MKCLNWNLQWATHNERGSLIRELIAEIDPDVACYTEITQEVVPSGEVIESDSDYGYFHRGNRRKVVLWSKTGWSDIDTHGDAEMPTGRFASGVTQGIRFVGVCIPWKMAHVNGGAGNRSPWQDHLAYCHGLKAILSRYTKETEPICVLGDFNQRIPRKCQPLPVAKTLLEAIPTSMSVATAGKTDAEGTQLIDHFVTSAELSITIDEIIPKVAVDGTTLSDHVGIVATM